MISPTDISKVSAFQPAGGGASSEQAGNWRAVGPQYRAVAVDQQAVGVELLIDDKTLRAIGLVSAQWGILEIEFDGLLGILVRLPATASITSKQIPQAFDRRTKLSRDCTALISHDQIDLRNELSDIINEATSAHGQRNDVTHGHWHLGRKKGRLGTTVTIINRRPNFKTRLKNMSADQVEDVVATISQVTAKSIWWRTMNVRNSPLR